MNNNVPACLETVRVINKCRDGVLLENKSERIAWTLFDQQYVKTEQQNVYKKITVKDLEELDRLIQEARIKWLLPKLSVILVAINNKDDLKFASYCDVTQEYIDEYMDRFNMSPADFILDVLEAKKEIEKNVR